MASQSVVSRIIDALTIKGLVVKHYGHSADKVSLNDVLGALPGKSHVAVVCTSNKELEEIESKYKNVTGLMRLDCFGQLKSQPFDLLIHPRWCSKDVIPERCKSGEVSFVGMCLLDEQDNHKLTFSTMSLVVKPANVGISSLSSCSSIDGDSNSGKLSESDSSSSS